MNDDVPLPGAGQGHVGMSRQRRTGALALATREDPR